MPQKKQKFAALLFLSLITCICEVSGVKVITSNEIVKNERALTTRTVERVVGESVTVATPEHYAATKSRKAIWIEKML